MTFIDMFAGIGGFRLGLERAGHKCLGFVEKDKYAVKSYRAMYDTEGEYYADDITRIRAEELPRADIWCFGFPCQDISIAGKGKGIGGNRSSLFFAVTRIINNLKEENKPSYLIVENVKNLFSVNGGFDFARVLIELESCGYDAQWQLFNSKHYGLPQNRERVYIVGFLRSRGARKILPVPRKTNGTLKQLVGGSQGCRVYGTTGIGCAVKSGAGGLGGKTGLYLVTKQNNILKIKDTVNCIDSNYYKGLDCHRQRTGVLEVNANGERAIRRLTPKEAFRIQGFPDELFEQAQKVNSDTQLYKQAGNAVSVNVVYEIGKRLY